MDNLRKRIGFFMWGFIKFGQRIARLAQEHWMDLRRVTFKSKLRSNLSRPICKKQIPMRCNFLSGKKTFSIRPKVRDSILVMIIMIILMLIKVFIIEWSSWSSLSNHLINQYRHIFHLHRVRTKGTQNIPEKSKKLLISHMKFSLTYFERLEDFKSRSVII